MPVQLSLDVGRLAPVVEATIYFVCAETLANVVKHAQASQAAVTVSTREATVVASITDDGRGGVDPSRGTGLRGLADRVEALGGRFLAADGQTVGTAVTVEIPVGRGFD